MPWASPLLNKLYEDIENYCHGLLCSKHVQEKAVGGNGRFILERTSDSIV